MDNLALFIAQHYAIDITAVVGVEVVRLLVRDKERCGDTLSALNSRRELNCVVNQEVERYCLVFVHSYCVVVPLLERYICVPRL